MILPTDLSEKVAVVTGAARGLGKAIACELSRDNCVVVAIDILEEQLIETWKEIATISPKSQYLHLDVTNCSQVRNNLNAIADKLGRIDILVNAAGKGQRTPFIHVTEDVWDSTFNTNCKSVYNLCSATVPYMVKQMEGCIINISSVAGIRGGGLLSKNAYAAAKGAVISLTKALARELSEYNIRVNCIAPGAHETPATKDLPSDERERVLNQIPLKRFGDPNDLAQAVVFLASPAATFITGLTLVVDGGFATL